MEVAAQHRDVGAQRLDQCAGRLEHGAAKIAHDGARSTEARDRRAEAGQDRIGALGVQLPRPQDPTAPTGQGDQQRAAPRLPRRIDVQRVATIAHQDLTQPRSLPLVQRLQVDQEVVRQGADLAGGQRDPVLLVEAVADLLALEAVDIALKADMDQDVVADGATRQE